MVLSLPEFRQDKLPLRVLDVDATLCSNGMFKFCDAESFSDFCVISHRWNPHVVQLMDEINEATTELELSYPQAVTRKNWAQLPAYVSIKEFLEVLQEQGVKKVWMDTLCIDQSKDSNEDSKKNNEKSREIPLMGAFYRHSSACYVPINGFGFGYKLPMGQLVTESLPWINRVWTLQEFLLPDRLFFLVEVEQWMEEWLSRRVATAGKDLSHFCTCCVGEFSFLQGALERMSREMEGVTSQVEKNLRDVDVNRICEHCKSPPLLRKVKNKGQLYLVQREAIFAIAWLAQFHERVKSNDWVESDEQRAKRSHEEFTQFGRNEWLLRVMHVRRNGIWFNTFEIMEEVCNRRCEREPDFVLGVLGLMGVNATGNNQQEQLGEEKGALQLNAQTSQEQLVQLAFSRAFSEQLLVELCALGNKSHGARSMPGMSWIPDVASGSISGFVPRYNDKTKVFHSMASNVRVAPDGPITLTLKVLKGYVTRQDSKNLLWEAEEQAAAPRLHFRHESLVYGEYEKDRNKADLFNYTKQFTREEVERFNQEHSEVEIEEEDRAFGGLDGKTELTFNEDGSFRLPLRNQPGKFHGFGMWLLYLGHFRGSATVLLCLHKAGAGNVVHKIGSLPASYMGMRGVFERLEDPPQEVTIGGYGMYLDDVVEASRAACRYPVEVEDMLQGESEMSS